MLWWIVEVTLGVCGLNGCMDMDACGVEGDGDDGRKLPYIEYREGIRRQLHEVVGDMP